jgi:hypothetical protein
MLNAAYPNYLTSGRKMKLDYLAIAVKCLQSHMLLAIHVRKFLVARAIHIRLPLLGTAGSWAYVWPAQQF